MEGYQVSVIVASYHPVWEKLRATLLSVLLQRGVSLEILLADDGSENYYPREVEALFRQHRFTAYRIVHQEKNTGTVRNIQAALPYCTGRYVKLISPGDALYSPTVLAAWAAFMDQNPCAVSFCDAAYYAMEDKGPSVYRLPASPMYRSLFREPLRPSRIRKNYLLSEDLILGASTLVETAALTRYLGLISGKVILHEDMIYRLMIYDGLTVRYFEETGIWYEYGTGISTARSAEQLRRFRREFASADAVLRERPCRDFFSRRFRALLWLRGKTECQPLKKIMKCAVFPETLYWKRQCAAHAELTPPAAPDDFFSRIFASNEKEAAQ